MPGRGRPGRYQILAAINAVHTDAGTFEETDWRQVVALYDQLYAVESTAVVALNRSIAVAELEGPRVGLGAGGTARRSRRTARGRRRGLTCFASFEKYDEARSAYDAAIALTGNEAEKSFLRGASSARSCRS